MGHPKGGFGADEMPASFDDLGRLRWAMGDAAGGPACDQLMVWCPVHHCDPIRLGYLEPSKSSKGHGTISALDSAIVIPSHSAEPGAGGSLEKVGAVLSHYAQVQCMGRHQLPSDAK